jgi:hypothetical protein
MSELLYRPKFRDRLEIHGLMLGVTVWNVVKDRLIMDSIGKRGWKHFRHYFKMLF